MIVKPKIHSNGMLLAALAGAPFMAWCAIPLYHPITSKAYPCQGSLKRRGLPRQREFASWLRAGLGLRPYALHGGSAGAARASGILWRWKA